MFPRKSQSIRALLSLLVFSFVLVSQTASAVETFRIELTGKTMGTEWNVKIDPGDPTESPIDKAQSVKAAIIARLAEINDRMSTYLPESEVSRFNAHDSTEWFEVSDETARVVKRAIEIHADSDGAFDITVMPLVDLWGFGPTKRVEEELPSDAEIADALKRVGSDKIVVRDDPASLKKELPEIRIDLSAIAKGYAVDEISKLLDEHGFEMHLVEIGGEVRAGDAKQDGGGWRVAVENPRVGVRDWDTVIELENQSLASSGNYRNFFEHNGVTYGHTIDPRTGWPVQLKLLAASIVADDCMTADAMATTCMVLGSEESVELVESSESSALMFVETEDGIEQQTIGRFPGNQLASDRSDASQPAKKSVGFLPMFGAVAIVLLLAVFAMSLGVLLGGKRIKGSCGALASSGTDISSPCDLCSKPASDCPEKAAAEEQAAN